MAKTAKKKAATKKKGAAKRPAKKAAAPKKKSARKPNAAFMRPVTPDATLATVVGAKPLPRTELTKKLWAYIKKNNLQDKTNRRQINADANLKAVFGGKSSVDMFSMTKLVGKHVS
jgi:chromatin remodeling complex protein RSC6